MINYRTENTLHVTMTQNSKEGRKKFEKHCCDMSGKRHGALTLRQKCEAQKFSN